MPPSNPIDIIATQILLDAKTALINLKNFNTQVNDSSKRISILKDIIKATATQMGGIGNNLSKAESKVKSFANSLTGIKAAEVSQAGKEITQLGNRAEDAFGKVVTSVNIARIAIGAFISMLLFQGIQAVTTFFTQAIQQARDFEATLYRISNAERQLSKEGIDVSVKELKQGIKDIQEALPIFSKEDIAQLIGGLATTTKELGYTGEEVLKLGAAVAILNINSTETETLLQTMGKVANSLISPQAKSIGSLGLAFGKLNIEAKAVNMNLLEAGETIEDLTEQEIKDIKLQIVLETAGIDGVDDLEKLRDIVKEAGGDFDALNEYLESNDAKLYANKAAWNDLSTTIGQILLPLIPVATDLFKGLEDAANGIKVIFIEAIVAIGTFGVILAGVMNGSIKNTEDLTNALKISVDTLREDMVNKLFKEQPDNAPKWFKVWSDLIKEVKETPTGEIDLSVEGGEDALKTLEELDDKLRDIALDAEQAKADLEVVLGQKEDDIQTKFDQKTQDIDTEYQRKEIDAATDLQRKIADIERDAERDRQRVLDNARDDERKAEEDHQLKLWELKMRYLMDLEDALHARDARQIIRLQRQYELDKELLEKKKEQEDEERALSLEADLADVEAKRQERLQDAQIEYQQKLADLAVAKARELEELNVWKAREQADLALWYQRELDEIDRQTQQKIERLLAGYIEEQKLHADQQEAIHQILLKYFGKNMALVDGLVAYTSAAFANLASLAQAVSSYSGGIGSGYIPGGLGSPYSGGMGSGYIPGMAEGGSIIATKPTRAMFGERGAELATFTPLNRNGRDVNKLFGEVGGGGGEGRISLDILLSPDLEARIVENSMDGVADVLARINRSKVN